ncbi:MMPL family transporter, partial [bacterium]|nr:MMPL family transporter [bacterium]
KHPDVLTAMKKTGEHVIPSLVSGAITTAAAFLTIYFIDFKGFSDYGLVAVVGILGSLLAFVLFFPVLVFVLERIRPLNIRPRQITVLEKIYLFLFPRKKIVLWIVGIVTLVSIGAFFDIPFEYDMAKLSFKSTSGEYSHSLVDQYESHVKKEKSDAFSRGRISVYLTNSQEEAGNLADRLVEMQKNGEGKGRIEAVVSMRKFVPQNQQEKMRIIKRMKRLIERKINLLSDSNREIVEKDIMPLLTIKTVIEQEKLPAWISQVLKEQDGSVGKFVLLLLSGNYKDMKNVTDIKETFGVVKANGKEFKMMAPYLLLADVSKVLHRDVPLMALYAILAVILTLLIMFRSLKYMFELLTPLLIALILMFGVVWVFDIKFNLFNLIIVPTMLGTGIDSSIHIFHRFLAFDKHKSKIPYILNHTGGAVLFSSITTLVGFASLMISSHQGMVSIGVVASIGIILATAVNLLVFPLLMRSESQK